jgi:hypothetical protein
MTPAEIIKQQAAAVTGFNKLTAAEHLEAAAKLLREEAGQSKEIVGIAALRAAKLAGRQRGAAMFNAIGKAKQDAFNAALADGGWKLMQKFDAQGMEYYHIPNKPGHTLVIKKDKFQVYVGGEVTLAWSDTKNLQAWVDSKKKK